MSHKSKNFNSEENSIFSSTYTVCSSIITVYLQRQSLTSDVVEVVAVQLILKRGQPHCHHVLVFGRQKLSQL